MNIWIVNMHGSLTLRLLNRICIILVCSTCALSTQFLLNPQSNPEATLENGCHITNTSSIIHVYCSHLGLGAVPDHLPGNTVTLDLSFNRIEVLYNHSLHYLRQLATLRLEQNLLSHIEHGAFVTLARLHTLSLEKNILTTLGAGLFHSNQHLSVLLITNNKLSHIPIKSFPLSDKIWKLNLASNNISAFNPQDMITLQNSSLFKFMLSNNTLQSLPPLAFAYLKTVTNLYLGGNNIPIFNMESLLGNMEIKKLDLPGCKIRSITPLNKSITISEDSPNIYELNLFGNQIISLPEYAFYGLGRINTLGLRANSILEISNQTLCGLDNLQELDLSRNKITTMPIGTFVCNPRLQELKIRDNKIATVPLGVFIGLPSLHHVDLSNNILIDITSSFKWVIPSITILDLSHNRFINIKKYFLFSCTTLKVLKMSNNIIETPYSPRSFAKLPYLEELDLSSQKTQSINKAFSQMKRLRKLDLSYTDLKVCLTQQFTNTISLKELKMRKTNLRAPDLYDKSTGKSLFAGLVSLIKLYLRENHLNNMETGVFTPLKTLQILDLAHADITILKSGIFEGLTALTTLHLSDNNIIEMSGELLRGQHSLRALFFSNNELRSIPKTLFNETSKIQLLRLDGNKISLVEEGTAVPTNRPLTLDVSSNPFSCTCDLVWFRMWLHGSNVELLHPNNTLCSHASLSPFANSPILSFHPEQLCRTNVPLITGLLFSAISIGFLCLMSYKKRWWFNYKFFLLKLAVFGYEEINEDFDADYYEHQLNLMFHEADQNWVDEVMKPGLRERLPQVQNAIFGDGDLNLGMFYINALYDAIENSFKTVLLLSNQSVEDAWFMTKVRMALEHLNDTRLDKVVLVFVEEIADDHLPYLVRLFLSRNKPYMLWTDDEDGQDLFWAQFQKSMRANRAINNVIPI